MAKHHNPRIVTDGLVLCLDAANKRSYPGSGTTWFDLSGNGNNGTLVNGVGFNGDSGGSLVFDGVDDYVTTQSTITEATFTNNTYALVSWFKWNGGGGGGDGRNYILQNGGSNFSLSLEINSRDFNPPRFSTWEHTTSGSAHYNTSMSVSNNQWYHFVVSTGISNTVKIFVNGVEILSATSIGGNLLPFSGFRVGTYRFNDNRWFDGSISLVQIYNRALTLQEIQQNFNALRGRYGV